MAVDPVTAGLGLFDTLIDKFVPDKDLGTKLKAGARSEEFQGELQLKLGQLAINKVEAASKSLFVAGWRPFTGWVCGFGVLYHFILYPFLQFIAILLMDKPPEFPQIEIYELLILLGGMLGLSRNRTAEKLEGVSREK